MNSTILNARTVAVVRDLRTEKRQGANGEFEVKDILVRIAVDRGYKITKIENGKQVEEKATDFWLAKFTGKVAQAFADHCTFTKEDGKLHSRHLLLSGNFENYKKAKKIKKTITPQVNINGQVYQLNLEVELEDENNTETIFIVDSMEFLDKNPNPTSSNSVVVTSATPVVAQATPVAVPQTVSTPAQNVVPVAQPTVAPAQNVTPVAQVATPAQTAVPTPVATQTTDISQAMNPPVVDANFVPAGQTAPF